MALQRGGSSSECLAMNKGMTLDEYIADACNRDPEFSREYHSPERDLFISRVVAAQKKGACNVKSYRGAGGKIISQPVARSRSST